MPMKPRLPSAASNVRPISKELLGPAQKEDDSCPLLDVFDHPEFSDFFMESFAHVADPSSTLDPLEMWQPQDETWESSFDYKETATTKPDALESSKRVPCPVSAPPPLMDLVSQSDLATVPHTVSPTLTSCHVNYSSIGHPNYEQTSPRVSPVGFQSAIQLDDLYTSPLHNALRHGTSLPIVKAIVQASASLLTQKDGPEGLTPLILSLNARPQDSETHCFLLQALPNSAAIASGANLDLPLHMACQGFVSMDVVLALIQAHPMALYQANVHGLTPWDIVTRRPDSFHSRVLSKLLREANMSLQLSQSRSPAGLQQNSSESSLPESSGKLGFTAAVPMWL
ncbi:expressed unknown protein [Seminavis robusta]|uniref:Uncharacterized protein n=1 Tax=Seminavis robusta TaxID=568900 RepID=A0A9N8DWY6_9STRA|nr:expressed unknown protein [Seminavis robusta]|eukprot:Sro356_g125310.1 n/a (340) ;mRNA; r:25345-26364